MCIGERWFAQVLLAEDEYGNHASEVRWYTIPMLDYTREVVATAENIGELACLSEEAAQAVSKRYRDYHSRKTLQSIADQLNA